MAEEILDLPWSESAADSNEQMAICYPDVRWEDVPDFVKEKSVAENLPITAVYGEYLSCREARRKSAMDALARSRALTPGLPRGSTGERLYSIEEMRAMPLKEVRSRYGSLLASLRRGFSKE